MALLAYFEGDTSVELLICRDDDQETPIPVSHFFRDPSEFIPIENKAIDNQGDTSVRSIYKKDLHPESLDITYSTELPSSHTYTRR